MVGVPVLMYHRICRDEVPADLEFLVSESVFALQMEYLAAHAYSTVPLRDADLFSRDSRGLRKKSVVLTFDDGYRDNLEIAVPILRRFGFTAAVFLVGAFQSGSNWWDTMKGLKGESLLRPADLRVMEQEGVEFGSHTMNHVSLPGLSDDEMVQELRESKALLERFLHHPVFSVAYPYGDVNPRVKTCAREAGYSMGFATNSGPLRTSSDPFEIRRVPMENRADASYMIWKLSGLDKAFRWTKWSMKRLVGKHNLHQSELRSSS